MSFLRSVHSLARFLILPWDGDLIDHRFWILPRLLLFAQKHMLLSVMGKCGCFLSCTYIRIVFCLSMSGKVGHNIAIRTSQLYRLSIRQNYLFLTQGLAQLVLHTYRLLIPLYTAQSHRRTSSSSRRGSLPSEASRPRFQCSHHQAE